MTNFDRDWGGAQKNRLQQQLSDERDQMIRNQGNAGAFLIGVFCTLFWAWALWVWLA